MWGGGGGCHSAFSISLHLIHGQIKTQPTRLFAVHVQAFLDRKWTSQADANTKCVPREGCLGA